MRTLLAAFLLLAVPAGQALAGETIYQYRDAKGVIHLSNRKLDDKFQPFDYMRLPAGTENGQKLRVRGRGLPKGKSGERGDFFVTIHIVLPERVSDAERELWEKLRATSTFNPRA